MNEKNSANHISTTVGGYDVTISLQQNKNFIVHAKNQAVSILLYKAAKEALGDNVKFPEHTGFLYGNFEVSSMPVTGHAISAADISAIASAVNAEYPNRKAIIDATLEARKYFTEAEKHEEALKKAHDVVDHLAGVTEHYMRDKGTPITLPETRALAHKMAEAYVADAKIAKKADAAPKNLSSKEARDAVMHMAGVAQKFLNEIGKPIDNQELQALVDKMAEAHIKDSSIKSRINTSGSELTIRV
ncbi:MAG: hypothetical protein ACK502_02815 [Alphaproteobacteria bacterium]